MPKTCADDLSAAFHDGFGGVKGEGAGVGYAGDEKALVVEHVQHL